MKDAMKGREMDERTTRLLNLAKTVDQTLGPLKPILEQVKPLREALDKFPAVPVVTDYKPLRAPGYQSRKSGAPELRTAQDTGAPSTKTTPGSPIPNYEDEKQRTTSPECAVTAGMIKRGKQPDILSDAIAQALAANRNGAPLILWQWITEKAGDWGMSYDKGNDTLTWTGKAQPVKYKAFQKRLQRTN